MTMKIDLSIQSDAIVTRLGASGSTAEVSIQKKGSQKWITVRMTRSEAMALVDMIREIAEQVPDVH